VTGWKTEGWQMTHLKFKDIKIGDGVTWHPEYHREKWKDPHGPFIVTSVARIDKKTFYVGYKCLQESCRRCQDTSLIVQGHHKLIKQGGLDLHGRVEFIEKKKRTIVNHIDQPVFISVSLYNYLI
jgi:hypothetical protein